MRSALVASLVLVACGGTPPPEQQEGTCVEGPVLGEYIVALRHGRHSETPAKATAIASRCHAELRAVFTSLDMFWISCDVTFDGFRDFGWAVSNCPVVVACVAFDPRVEYVEQSQQGCVN